MADLRIGSSCRWFKPSNEPVGTLTTRYRGNSAWIDLDTCEITPSFGIRPGCQVNSNLYRANGVLNMPNLTGG